MLNGRTPKEILDTELYFVDRIGLSANLSPTRANGLVAMIKQMRLYALAFETKVEAEEKEEKTKTETAATGRTDRPGRLNGPAGRMCRCEEADAAARPARNRMETQKTMTPEEILEV